MARTKKTVVENQEQNKTVTEKKRVTQRKEKRDWFKIIEISFTSIILIITVVSLIYTVKTSQRNLEIANKNNEFVERTLKKDLPAEFNVIFTPSINSEIIRMQNVSKVETLDINLELKFYYIFADGKIFTRKSLIETLNKNENLLQKFQSANLIKYANDIDFLLGRNRYLQIGEMEPEGTRVFDDFPSITIENALRISQILEAELIARVKVNYKIKETLKQRTDYKFIWIHNGNKLNQTLGRENLTREDLTNVIGGKKVIETLQNFEDATKEVIFSEIEQTNPL